MKSCLALRGKLYARIGPLDKRAPHCMAGALGWYVWDGKECHGNHERMKVAKEWKTRQDTCKDLQEWITENNELAKQVKMMEKDEIEERGHLQLQCDATIEEVAAVYDDEALRAGRLNDHNHVMFTLRGTGRVVFAPPNSILYELIMFPLLHPYGRPRSWGDGYKRDAVGNKTFRTKSVRIQAADDMNTAFMLTNTKNTIHAERSFSEMSLQAYLKQMFLCEPVLRWL